MSPGPERGKERARFYVGIAAAMADQWGRHISTPTTGATPSAPVNLPAASASQGGGLCVSLDNHADLTSQQEQRDHV